MPRGLEFTDLLTNSRVRFSMLEVEKIERKIHYTPKTFFDYKFTFYDGREIMVAENEIAKYLDEKRDS